MTRPTLHPIDNKIYTGLLLILSSHSDGITQTELHNLLNRITNNNHSVISTLQKIKKLEIYKLIFKDEKGGQRNTKKVFINSEAIIWTMSLYSYHIQKEISEEIKQEYNHWKLIEEGYKNSTFTFSDDFHKILFENIIEKNSNSYDYINKYFYTQDDFFTILNNRWFNNIVKYILSFHSRNAQYYKVPFSQLLFSIIEYFTTHYESIDEYISNYTTEKLIDLQNQIFNFEGEKEIHDYIQGKNNTLEIFKHIRNLKFFRPMYSHTPTALWILESQTTV